MEKTPKRNVACCMEILKSENINSEERTKLGEEEH